MNQLTEALLTIVTAIVGVAILSVLVSNRANTANVLGAFGASFSNMLSAATAPVTGRAATPNLTVGTSGGSPFSGGSLLSGSLSLSPGSFAG